MKDLPIKSGWKQQFIFIWIGQFISLITSSAVNFAVIIWLSLETGSASVLATAAIAALLPQAVLGPFAGVFIDRWDRKKTIIWADLFIAISTVLLIAYFHLFEISLLPIYVLLALRSVGSAFHMPAMQAAVPLIAPQDQLLRIAGINQMIQSVSSIGGPALGALAIGLLSIDNVLWLDVAGAIIAVATLLFVHIPKQKVAEAVSTGVTQVFLEIKAGAQAVLQNKGLTWIFFYSIVATFFIMPVAILFPLFTLEHFKGGKWEMSIIEVVWGIGMLIGGSILGIFKPGLKKVIIINAMHILLGLTFAISGLLDPNYFVLFCVLTTLGGVSMSIFSASFNTTLQETVNPSLLGRVFSMYFSIAILPSLLGLTSAGLLADHIGIDNTFIISGCLVIFIGIASFFTKSLMKLGNTAKIEPVDI